MAEHDEVIRHVIVPDCNIYLDVAELLGPPFTWEKLQAAAADLFGVGVPHPEDLAYDSLRTIVMCETGLFAGDEVVEVWTSSHIDKLVRGKAMHSASPDPTTHRRGLGWNREDAQGLLDGLVGGITERSNGGTVGDNYPEGNPPLDHEDGMVFGACRWLAGWDPLAKIYLVTRDRGILAASKNGQLPDHTRVLTPSMYVQLTQAARGRYSMGKMLPKPKSNG